MTLSLIDGVGGSLGDRLVTEKPIVMSGNVWYVDFTNGTDAASPAGRERLKPLKTIAQAVTNASAADIVVLINSHAETLTAVQAIAKALLIVGEGSAGGIPSCSFTRNVAGASLFTPSVAGVEFRNIRFKASGTSTATNRIPVTGARCHFTSCYFESGANDIGSCVDVQADYCRFENCTWVSTSTTTAPEQGLGCSTVCADLELRDCIFDGGTVGWANGLAFENITNIITRLRVEGLTLLRGADVSLLSTTTGFVNVGSATGGGRLAW